jgi:hypothetical protein
MSGKVSFLLFVVALVLVYLYVPGVRGTISGWFARDAKPGTKEQDAGNEESRVYRTNKVCWTDGSEHYHRHDCPVLAEELERSSRGTRTIPRTLAEAKELGLKPCPECNPPK